MGASRLTLICGLGNPGLAYANTRHNMGFAVVDYFAAKKDLVFGRPKDGVATTRGADFILAKPDTYMNLSGGPVSSLLRYYKIPVSQLLVVVDCIALEPGHIRFARKGGHAGQNGMKSVISHLGTTEFARLRIGIGSPKSRTKPLEQYVLETIPGIEESAYQHAIKRAAEAIDYYMLHGIDKAMNEFN